MADNFIKKFKISGDTTQTEYVIFPYSAETALSAKTAESMAGVWVNDSGNFEINNELAGCSVDSKINLVSCAAVQIKPGMGEDQTIGKVEAIQLDCEQGGNDCNEVTVKVCNGGQDKNKRVSALKLNVAELVLDTQKANTTEFDTEEMSIKYRYDKKDHPIYAKHKARAFDFRCLTHGGIALQIAGHDGDNHENKVKFESDRTSGIGEAAAYCGEGGKGLEFGTFNNLHTSLFSGDYRFKGDAMVYGATREIEVTEDKTDYKTQADDFKDIISNDNCASWNAIISAANKLDGKEIYSAEEVDTKIAEAQLSGGSIDPELFVTKVECKSIVDSAVTEAMSGLDLSDYYKKEEIDAKGFLTEDMTSGIMADIKTVVGIDRTHKSKDAAAANNGIVFRKAKNGNIEISAEGFKKWDDSGATIEEAASLDLVGNKISVKPVESVSLETTVYEIPVKITKKAKVGIGDFESDPCANKKEIFATALENVAVRMVIDENGYTGNVQEIKDIAAGDIIKEFKLMKLAQRLDIVDYGFEDSMATQTVEGGELVNEVLSIMNMGGNPTVKMGNYLFKPFGAVGNLDAEHPETKIGFACQGVVEREGNWVEVKGVFMYDTAVGTTTLQFVLN